MDPASIIGPKVRNFLSNEDTGKQACFELAPGFFIYSKIHKCNRLPGTPFAILAFAVLPACPGMR
jgi:hypothetical protein